MIASLKGIDDIAAVFHKITSARDASRALTATDNYKRNKALRHAAASIRNPY